MRMVALISLLVGTQAFAAGGVVNKGADIVYCVGTNVGPDSYYSLDYAVEISRGAKPDDFVQVNSWFDSMEKIKGILQQIDSRHSDLFSNFMASLEQIFPQKAAVPNERIWRKHKGRPLPVHSIGDVYTIAFGCKFNLPIEKSKGPFYRVIQRTQYHSAVVYQFDFRVMNPFFHAAPLQTSYLLVHEWLWDVTKDEEINRKLNAFLHSKKIDTMTADEIRAEWNRLFLPDLNNKEVSK